MNAKPPVAKAVAAPVPVPFFSVLNVPLWAGLSLAMVFAALAMWTP